MGSRSVASGGCIHSSSQTFQTSLRVARPKLVVRASTVDVFTAPQAQTWSPALKPADSATRAVERSLREWITAHGGFIHTSIRLTDNAPCGCRGVVASSPLTREDVEDPILVVPEVSTPGHHTRLPGQGRQLSTLETEWKLHANWQLSPTTKAVKLSCRLEGQTRVVLPAS